MPVDPRHQSRIRSMQALFSASFQPDSFDKVIKPLQPHLPKLDQIIQACAPEWPLTQINRVDLAILRLALYELSQHQVPYKVVIDEAVELAKEYGSENSAKFINGVLGHALKQLAYD